MRDINLAYMRIKKKVILKAGKGSLSKTYIGFILCELEKIGYIISIDIIYLLKTLSIQEANNFFKNLINNLKIIKGGHIDTDNFNLKPDIIMNKNVDDFYQRKVDLVIKSFLKGEDLNLEIIDLGSEEEFKESFMEMMMSKVYLNKMDKMDLEWFVLKYNNYILDLLSEKFFLMENFAYVIFLILKYSYIKNNILEQICSNL